MSDLSLSLIHIFFPCPAEEGNDGAAQVSPLHNHYGKDNIKDFLFLSSAESYPYLEVSVKIIFWLNSGADESKSYPIALYQTYIKLYVFLSELNKGGP